MATNAYLIPGWGEDFEDRDYYSVLKVYKAAGYQPEFVTVDWKYKTLNDWTEEVKSKLSRKDIENSLLSGFSFGAIISLVIAAEYAAPKKLLLFSLSPYFSDDIPKLKNWWVNAIGKRKIDEFKKLDFKPLAEKVLTPTLIFYGTKEGPETARRVKEANKYIKNSQLIRLEDVKHDIADPRYIAAIKKHVIDVTWKQVA